MPNTRLTIEFETAGNFSVAPVEVGLSHPVVPDWVKFSNSPCPGNIAHGPAIDYCRLGIEIEMLVNRFANINSTDHGVLLMNYPENLEVRIEADAQTLFFNSLWFVLLFSDCSVFKYGQWARSHFMPSSDPEKLFFALFSTFLVEDFTVKPDTTPQVDRFREQLGLLRDVLHNLLQRVRDSNIPQSDAVNNGILMFSNLIELLNLEFDHFQQRLHEHFNRNVSLHNWV